MGNNFTISLSLMAVISAALISMVVGFCLREEWVKANAQMHKSEKDKKLNGFINQTEIFGDKRPSPEEFIKEATCSIYEQRVHTYKDGILYEYNVYKFNSEYLVSPNINNPEEIYFLRKDGNPVTRREDLENALLHCLDCSEPERSECILRQSGHVFSKDGNILFTVNGKRYVCRRWCEYCWDGNDWNFNFLHGSPRLPDIKSYFVSFCILDKSSHDVVSRCPITDDSQRYFKWPKEIEEWVCAEGADKVQERLDRIEAVEES